MSAGIAWTASSNVIVQCVQLVAFIVLARLLGPADFGLVAIVVVITTFAQLLTDLGLGSALIQLKVASREARSCAFWVNMASGATLCLLVVALSDPLAAAFGESSLAGLIRLGSLNFVVSAAVVQVAMLERHFRFCAVAVADVLAAIVGYGVSIVAAIGGMGAASIVLGPLVMAATLTLMLWCYLPFIPGRFSRTDLRDLWQRGAGVTGFNIINYWGRNADNVLLGKFASAADLGFYSRAYSFMMAPVNQVTGALGRVLLPTLARIEQGSPGLSQTYLRSLRMCTAVLLPVTGLAACSAWTFTDVVLGHKWAPMAPILCLLAASCGPQLLAGTTGAVYQARGASRSLFWRGGLLSVLTIGACVAGLPWGPVGIAVALCVRYWALLPWTMAMPLSLTGLSARELVIGLRAIVAATVGACAVGAALCLALDRNIAAFATAVGSGLIVYVLLMSVFDRQLINGVMHMIAARIRRSSISNGGRV